MWNPFKRSADTLLTASDKQMLVEAIQLAEKHTCGEIRVYVESKVGKKDALSRATEIFFKNKMNETRNRNGVLIYVAVRDKKIAIYGDQGIYEKLGLEFWYSQIQDMTGHFKETNYVQGIATVIKEVGNALSSHFPYNRATDINELPDEIMIGK
jgi:uncharacterized membrane protein